jgi:Glycosyl hydrolases family 25
VTHQLLADISSYEHGLRIQDLRDCAGVLAKCSEGTYYGDLDYDGWRIAATQAGKLFVAYDFVRADEPPDAQAAWIAAHIVDTALPLMLDVETEGSSRPTFPQVLALVHACVARGLRPRLAYIPRWYWAQIGSPDMSELNTLGVGLISSAYPNTSISVAEQDYAAVGGDSGVGWQPYGGVNPMLWQYSDHVGDGGYILDMNAWRGALPSLEAFLAGTPAPTTTPAGGTMGTYTMGTGWQTDYPDVAAQLQQHIPAGSVIDEGTAAALAMVRSFVGTERTGSIEIKVDQLAAAVAALAARVGTVPTPAVDVAALAALLAPHLTAGATAEEMAHAVAVHLGADLAAG